MPAAPAFTLFALFKKSPLLSSCLEASSWHPTLPGRSQVPTPDYRMVPVMPDALRPIAFYLLGMALTMGGLYLRSHQRSALLPLVWTALILSLKELHQAPSVLGFNVQLGMTNFITILATPVIFSSFDFRLRISAPYLDLPTAYLLYNNPRGLALAPSRLPSVSAAKRRRFAALRALDTFLILALRAFRDRVLAAHMATLTMGDFRPSREWIVPRILGGELSSHELAVRAHVSLSWVFDTYAQLTLLHITLSVVFVIVLQVDRPEEWPSLFGSPLEAFTLRRFWGTFWHRLLSPSAAAWAQFIFARVPLLRRIGSGGRKLFVAYFIFTASGLAHVLVGWRLGDEALMRDLYFFWANFAAVALEIVIAKVVPGAIRSLLPPKREILMASRWVQVVARGVGYLWVMSWFIATIPHVLFPKIHAAISAQLLAATFKTA